RLTEQARTVHHVPAVLIRRDKPAAVAGQDACRAVQAALDRRDQNASAVQASAAGLCFTRRRLVAPATVSVIFQGNRDAPHGLLDSVCAGSGHCRPKLHLVEDRESGLAERLNKAAAAARGEYLLFLRAAGALTEDWLVALCEQGQRPDVAAVGG